MTLVLVPVQSDPRTQGEQADQKVQLQVVRRAQLQRAMMENRLQAQLQAEGPPLGLQQPLLKLQLRCSHHFPPTKILHTGDRGVDPLRGAGSAEGRGDELHGSTGGGGMKPDHEA